MRRVLLLALAVLILMGEFAPVMGQGFFFGRPRQYDQQEQQPPRQHRTLLDMLFGPRRQDLQDDRQQPQVVAPPVVRKPKPAQLPPAKPTIAKAQGATRVAVFGDSLAADIGKALDRFYADDPNVAVLQQAVGSSGLVRTDYFDWNKAVGKQIDDNAFDVAVVMIGINDRQTMTVDGNAMRSLTDDWKKEYSARLTQFLGQLRAANKPVIWIGLPPTAGPQTSAAMSQISALERLAAFGNGAEFVDIYDKFLDEDGNYTSYGPDVNGNNAQMRRSDGIHFTNAGADKVVSYANQALKLFVHGGTGLAVVDPLAGSDAATMLRPPYQGLGQAKLLQVAGAVVPLTGVAPRASALVEAGQADVGGGFDMKQLLDAPVGRADAFGAGVRPEATVAASP